MSDVKIFTAPEIEKEVNKIESKLPNLFRRTHELGQSAHQKEILLSLVVARGCVSTLHAFIQVFRSSSEPLTQGIHKMVNDHLVMGRKFVERAETTLELAEKGLVSTY